MEILVIAAHPDDEVLGLGGTICKLASEGHNLHLLIITDGSTSQYKDNPDLESILKEKEEETIACSKILGFKTIDYGLFPDMLLDTIPHLKLNECIQSYIQKYKIDTVFSHFYGDVNKDHRCVFESTMVSTRPFPGQTVKRVYLYRTPSSSEWNIQINNYVFSPTVFFDISNYENQKMEAIKCYQRELREYPHPRSVASIKQLDASCGNSIGTKFAECFVLARDIRD